MARKIVNQTIEAGDFVEMLDGPEAGAVWTYENTWVKDGVEVHTCINDADPDVFLYVTAIKLYAKAA